MEVYSVPDNPLPSQNIINSEVKKKRFNFDKKFLMLGLLVGFLVVVGTFALLLITKGPEGIKNLKPSVFSPLANRKMAKEENKKTVMNPLNGEMFTPQESESWVNNRPLGVMINNHFDARPQAGLIDADLVYEVVAEGGITRFLAFYQSKLPEKIGPVRSTREYYLVLVKEMGDAMLMHHGYSPQALVDIETWPVRSLQRGNAPYWRDNPRNVAIEHTLYASGPEVFKKGLELGWEGKKDDFRPWSFKESKDLYAGNIAADTISYDFWYENEFSVSWKYDSTSNTYARYMGFDAAGNFLPHNDELTKEQIKVKSLVVQFATEDRIPGDEKNRLDYQLVGSGKALVFLDGKVIEATWSKSGRDDRTLFYDNSGSEIQFNRGKIWVSVLPDRNIGLVKYSSAQTAETAPSN